MTNRAADETTPEFDSASAFDATFDIAALETALLEEQGQQLINNAALHLAQVIGRRYAVPTSTPLEVYQQTQYAAFEAGMTRTVTIELAAPDGPTYVVTQVETTAAGNAPTTQWTVLGVLGECCGERLAMPLDGRTDHNTMLHAIWTSESTGRLPTWAHTCERRRRFSDLLTSRR